MGKGRLVAFSDGVFAIIITIMVLGLTIPHGADWGALRSKVPIFLTYALSFTNLGIYWVNHHHLLHTVHRVSGGILWANLHLLFWLSLVPFTTGWMGENHVERVPTAVYGIDLLLASIAYFILARLIIVREGADSALARAVGRDRKGKLSTLIYAVAVALSFLEPWLAVGLYVIVALIWLVPDRRIERVLGQEPGEPK